jgi:hypothetical protein
MMTKLITGPAAHDRRHGNAHNESNGTHAVAGRRDNNRNSEH